MSGRAWREFPSQVWQAAVDQVERTAEKQNAGALRSKGRRKRTLWTTAGFVEFRRRRYFYAVGTTTLTARPGDLRADLGIAYDGKEKVGRKRRRLTNKPKVRLPRRSGRL
jgi:hypothetical protein